LNIVTTGEDFSKQNDRIEDLIEEVHMFMGTNPNQYEVTVGIIISIGKFSLRA
jgi:hypothetical protein